MGVTISERGNQRMLADIERAIGRSRINRLSHSALLKGAEVFVRELERQFETFKKTGASIEEITVSSEVVRGAPPKVTIHWRGPEERYRVIHLNEWGTAQQPEPKGKGAVARALRNAEAEYVRVIKRELQQALRDGT